MVPNRATYHIWRVVGGSHDFVSLEQEYAVVFCESCSLYSLKSPSRMFDRVLVKVARKNET